jgi:cytochrome c5
MRWRLIVAAGVATALAASIAVAAQAPASQPPPPPLDPVAILNGACAMCHGVDFIAEHRKDHDDWDFTVRRMMDKGADLDPDEAAALIDYLAKTYPKPSAAPPPSSR